MSRRARSRWRLLVTTLLAGVAFACASGESIERQSPASAADEAPGAEAVPSDAEEVAVRPAAPVGEPTDERQGGVLAEQDVGAVPDLLWPVRVLEEALAPPPPPPAPPPLPENPWYAAHQFSRVRLRPRVDDATVAHLIARARGGGTVDASALRVEGALAALGLSHRPPEAGALFSVEAEVAPLPFDQNIALLTIGIHTASAALTARPLVVVVDASRRVSAEDLAAARAATSSLMGGAEAIFAVHDGLERIPHLDDDARPRGSFDLARGLHAVVADLPGPRDILVFSPGPERNRIDAMGEACADAARLGHRVFLAGAPAPGLPTPILEHLARRGDGQSLHLDGSQINKSRFTTRLARARSVVLGRGVIEARFEPALVHGYRLLGYTRGTGAVEPPDEGGASIAADTDITLVFALELTGAGQRALVGGDPLPLGDVSLSGVREGGERALALEPVAALPLGDLTKSSSALRDVVTVVTAFQKARRDPALARLSFAEIRALANPRSPRAARVEQLLDVAEHAR